MRRRQAHLYDAILQARGDAQLLLSRQHQARALLQRQVLPNVIVLEQAVERCCMGPGASVHGWEEQSKQINLVSTTLFAKPASSLAGCPVAQLAQSTRLSRLTGTADGGRA